MSTPKITITINADSPDDFRKVLAGLLTGGAQSITTVYNNVEPPISEKGQAAAAKAAKATTTAKPKDEPKPEPEQPRDVKLVEPAKEFAEQPKQEAKPEPAKEPTPAKASSKKAAAAAESSGPAPELPENIKNTNSMRDLLTYLAEHGVDSADAMVATCTVLKKDVPILSKVPNVEERVRRALDVLALFPAAGDEAASAQA